MRAQIINSEARRHGGSLVGCGSAEPHSGPPIPGVQLHLTATYSPWISQVEQWFAELQRRRLDSGVFCSLDELTTPPEN